MTGSELRLSEAVPLGTAFVQEICRNNGIPALFIKGPAATILGVRPSHPSTDIDVLVRRKDMDITVTLLATMGWTIRGEGWEEFYSSHSVTLFHDQWPCDIDIHYRFPGMSSSEHAFNVLYAERQSVVLAGRHIDVPGPLGSICFQALHALRNPWLPAQKGNFHFLVNKQAVPDLEIMLDFTQQIGALAAMRPYFNSVYPSAESIVWPRPSREWIARTTARTRGSIRLMELIDAPWNDKYQILKRQLSPSKGTTIGLELVDLDRSPFLIKIGVRIMKISNFTREAIHYLRTRNRSAK